MSERERERKQVREREREQPVKDIYVDLDSGRYFEGLDFEQVTRFPASLALVLAATKY